MKSFILLTFIALFSINIFGQIPTFEQYSAKIEPVTAKSVNLKSHKNARKFRTVLTGNFETAKQEGADFAGRFIVASWGCGTSCLQSAIIDSKTGNIFFPKELQGTSVGNGELAEDETGSIQYQKDSRLFLVRGYTVTGISRDGTSINSKKYGIWYYEWTGKELKLLKFVAKKEHVD